MATAISFGVLILIGLVLSIPRTMRIARRRRHNAAAVTSLRAKSSLGADDLQGLATHELEQARFTVVVDLENGTVWRSRDGLELRVFVEPGNTGAVMTMTPLNTHTGAVMAQKVGSIDRALRTIERRLGELDSAASVTTS